MGSHCRMLGKPAHRRTKSSFNLSHHRPKIGEFLVRQIVFPLTHQSLNNLRFHIFAPAPCSARLRHRSRLRGLVTS